MHTDNVRLLGRPEVIGARSKRRDCQTVAALRFFFRGRLRRSDIIEHTTFVHEPRKLRPGHESNMLSPQLGDLPVGRLVERGVQPHSKKYFGFRTPQITSRTFRVPPHRGACHDRHERGVGCGGRGSVLRAMGSRGGSKDL
jgi:hypothetical protein